jgi:peptidoglycan/LPS O-acetylase OafA/YrhL
MPYLPNATRSLERTNIPQLNSLTSIRGIAAWWVVLFHFDSYIKPYLLSSVYGLIDKGYLAVDLFFCLSGFVIFMNYGTIDIESVAACRAFYAKRIAKIYPLHLSAIGLYLGLIGALALSHRPIPWESYSIKSLLFNLLLIQDWDVLKQLSWNDPSWSISAEFAAYLVFPVLALIVRPASKHIWYGALVIGGALILLNLCYAHEAYDLGGAITTFGVIRCASQFTIGAVLAAIFLRNPSPGRRVKLTLLAAAFSFFLAGLYALESIFIPIGWAALVLYLAFNDETSRLLRFRLLVFIGEISYATYMVHYFIRELFKLALVRENQITPASYIILTFLIIIIFSMALYWLIEKPAQRMIIKTVLARSRLSDDRH